MVIDDVIDAVCQAIKLNPEIIGTDIRDDKLLNARRLVVLMSRRFIRYDDRPPSWCIIGDYLNRHDTTVNATHQKAAKLLESDEDFRRIYMKAVRIFKTMPEGRKPRIKVKIPPDGNQQRKSDEWVKPKPKLDVKERTCLTCQRKFKSQWIGNRMCHKCKESKELKPFFGMNNGLLG